MILAHIFLLRGVGLLPIPLLAPVRNSPISSDFILFQCLQGACVAPPPKITNKIG